MRRTWGILVIALAILLVYPFAYQRISYLKDNFTSFNLLNGVMDKKEAKKLVENVTDFKSTIIAADSISLVESDGEGEGDNAPFEMSNLLDSHSNKSNIILNPAPPIDTSQIYSLLFRFFEALEKAEKNEGQARIFYFGDSMIEGDLITQTLRDKLQKQFGGEGVGWVPITSIVSRFRQTIIHSFSKNIEYQSLMKRRSKSFPIGIQGEVFKIKNDTNSTWVNYSASKAYQKLSTFPTTRFFYYGNSNQPLNSVGTLKIKKEIISLPNEKGLNTVWISKDPSKTINATFNLNSPIGAYGFSFESKNGVILDNFSLRGSNGISLLQISNNLIQEFNIEMNPCLIVLQYGLNVAQKNCTNYESYRIELEKLIKNFQKNCPQASILVMGVCDKGGKVDGEYGTEPSIPYLLEAQKSAAANCGVAFFSLFEAMGGEGSMVRWVKEEKPALANLDFTHVNGLGAAKIGNLIHAFLINGYKEYQNKAK